MLPVALVSARFRVYKDLGGRFPSDMLLNQVGRLYSQIAFCAPELNYKTDTNKIWRQFSPRRYFLILEFVKFCDKKRRKSDHEN